MNLALFDFDGTITNKDSLVDFIQYAVGKPKYYLGLLIQSPMLIAYKLKLLSNSRAKEKLLSHFFKGWSIDDFTKQANTYSNTVLPKIVRTQALEEIKAHQEKGHHIIIVSASIECWLQAWCLHHSIELLSTRLEVKDNIITGKFSTPNCFGIEKVNRVKEKHDLSQYQHIYAYGDSSGDKELLELAHECFYKPFRSEVTNQQLFKINE